MERRRGWLRFLCCEFSTASNNRAYFHGPTLAWRVLKMQPTFHDPPSCGYARVSVLARTRDREREGGEDTERTVTHREFFGGPVGGTPRENKEIEDERGLLFESSHIRRIVSCRCARNVFNGFTHVRPCADQLSPPRFCLLYNRGRVSFRQINRDSNVAFNVVVVTHVIYSSICRFYIGDVKSCTSMCTKYIYFLIIILK